MLFDRDKYILKQFMPIFLIRFNLVSHYNHVTEYTSPYIKAFCWPFLRCLLEYTLDYKALVVGMTRMCNNRRSK